MRPRGPHCAGFRFAVVAEAKFINFCVFDLQTQNAEKRPLMQKMAAGGAQPGSYFLASLAAFAPTEASGLKSGFRDIYTVSYPTLTRPTSNPG